MAAMPVAELELDLEIFTGPFDLLLTLILREEVDLLEVDLADVVLGYLDVLEARGELDLEAATEFLVLIAALLELKSRLMLPRDEEDLLELAPEEALEELVARMLDAQRYRSAAGHLSELLRGQEGVRFRRAPVPSRLRRTDLADLEAVYGSDRLGSAIGALLTPERIDARHITISKVSLPERLAHLRGLLRRGRRTVSFEEAVAGADRVTVCVTLWALLELYKEGEIRWRQDEPFSEIFITSTQVLEPDPGGTPTITPRTEVQA
jgi:segregation and condensation protein A